MAHTSPEVADCPATSFGDLLRQHRTVAKMSQAQLAAAVGASVWQISDWETGRRGSKIEREMVEALAEALGADEPDLLLEAAGHRRYVLEFKRGRPSFVEFTETEPTLDPEARRILVAVYRRLREGAGRRMSFEEFVETEPELDAYARDTLLTLFRQWRRGPSR